VRVVWGDAETALNRQRRGFSGLVISPRSARFVNTATQGNPVSREAVEAESEHVAIVGHTALQHYNATVSKIGLRPDRIMYVSIANTPFPSLRFDSCGEQTLVRSAG